MEYRISVQPMDAVVVCGDDDDLLTALHNAGIEVESICGGMGVCGKCRVRILEGETNEPTLEEEDHLTEEQLDAGWRLSCQVYPESDLSIQIPDSSLTHGQRLQLDCELKVEELEPTVRSYDLVVDVPSSPGDPGSDFFRLEEALRAQHPGAEIDMADLIGLRSMPALLRDENGEISAVVREEELLGTMPRGRSPLGLAMDLGSTKIALFLYDLSDGSLLTSHGFLNPQVPYGEDIVTRIQHATEGEALRLQEVVVQGINDNLSRMLEAASRDRSDIYEMVLVGNTAMHHLFLALPVEQLGKSPYLPATDLPQEVKARDLGLELHPAAVVYLPAPIAGYVGSDHLAAVAAARLWERPGPCLLLDIGTNTEVALQAGGGIRSCSCASGPAFEGGGLSQGMRAGDGAIEGVSIDPATGEIALEVIGDASPTGICGSGILAALAAMREAGIVDDGGRMREGERGVERHGGELLFYLFPHDSQGEGVAVTQNDVREIQKAKGAIRSGIDALLQEAGIGYTDVKEIVLAGAFGTYIDAAAALSISLLPPVPLERVKQVGNAAGAGARSMLLSTRLRAEAEDLASSIGYLELSAYPHLNLLFASDMYLSEDAIEEAKRRFKM